MKTLTDRLAALTPQRLRGIGRGIEKESLRALVEQDVAALHTNRRHRGQQISCRRFIQTGEKGGSAQHVVIHVGSVPEHP